MKIRIPEGKVTFPELTASITFISIECAGNMSCIIHVNQFTLINVRIDHKIIVSLEHLKLELLLPYHMMST